MKNTQLVERCKELVRERYTEPENEEYFKLQQEYSKLQL